MPHMHMCKHKKIMKHQKHKHQAHTKPTTAAIGNSTYKIPLSIPSSLIVRKAGICVLWWRIRKRQRVQ